MGGLGSRGSGRMGQGRGRRTDGTGGRGWTAMKEVKAINSGEDRGGTDSERLNKTGQGAKRLVAGRPRFVCVCRELQLGYRLCVQVTS